MMCTSDSSKFTQIPFQRQSPFFGTPWGISSCLLGWTTLFFIWLYISLVNALLLVCIDYELPRNAFECQGGRQLPPHIGNFTLFDIWIWGGIM